MSNHENKFRALQERIRQYGSVLVAYSGGVDSSLLLKVSTETLGPERALGVICKSDTLSEREFQQALTVAREHRFNLKVIEYSELDLPEFANNSLQRCYICKRELFQHLRAIAAKEKIGSVLDGATHDDISDFRPGMQAAREFEIESPLRDLHFTKEDIRALAKDMGLGNWNKPSAACLASRFPYGTHITRDRLNTVAEAEEFLHGLGLRTVRVRYHGDIARIEVAPEDVPLVAQDQIRQGVVAKMKSLGFTYVTLDLEGFRSGSLNEPMKRNTRAES
jgi:uncharacterized protein